MHSRVTYGNWWLSCHRCWKALFPCSVWCRPGTLFPFWWGAHIPSLRVSQIPGARVPPAVLCRCSYWNTADQPKPWACWEIRFILKHKWDELPFVFFLPFSLFPTRLDNATVWSACSYKKKLAGRLCNPNMGCRCVHLSKAMRWEQPDNCSIRRGLRYRDLLSSLPSAWPLANCFSSTCLRNKDNDTHPSALLWDCLLAAEQKTR